MSLTDTPSDRSLVAAAARGDQSAYRALYRAYVRPVFWLAHGLLGSTTDAEDVTQETFLAAWRKLPGLTLTGESVLPWLVTICRFQCANRVRKLHRDRTYLASAPDDSLPATVSVEDQVIAADMVERILSEVRGLSAVDQQIFRLCAAEGYSYQAAADQLGVSHAVVRNRLSRIRSRVRGSLETEGA